MNQYSEKPKFTKNDVPLNAGSALEAQQQHALNHFAFSLGNIEQQHKFIAVAATAIAHKLK